MIVLHCGQRVWNVLYLLTLLLWLRIWVVSSLAARDLCSPLHNSAPFSPLHGAPFQTNYSHLKEPVGLHYTWGCSRTTGMFQNSSSRTWLVLRISHLRCFLNTVIPRSSLAGLGQSPEICMLLNKCSKVALRPRQMQGVLRSWESGSGTGLTWVEFNSEAL